VFTDGAGYSYVCKTINESHILLILYFSETMEKDRITTAY